MKNRKLFPALAILTMAFWLQPPAALAADKLWLPPPTALAADNADSEATLDPELTVTPRDICITRLAATASSQHAKGRHSEAANTIDGNAQSGWESARDKLPKEPQSITLELDTPCVVDALRYFNSGTNNRGRITDYEIQSSSDGKEFTTVAAGQWDPQGPPEERVTFEPLKTRYVRLIAKSGLSNVARANQITLESPYPLPPKGEVVIPPAKDAAARAAAFAARQSPEALEQLAEQLSRFLRLDAPELKEFTDCYEQGDVTGALQAFNRAFAARLINRRATLDYMPFLEPVNPRLASLLLANIVDVRDGSFVDLGKPGSIDWDNGTAFVNSPHVEMFNQLLGLYEQAGDRVYLEKWAELVDDMAMHHQRDRLRPFEITNQDGQAWNLLHLLNRLMGVEQAHPGSLEALPPGTLPRLLMAILPQDIALNDTFFSSYAGNWHPENSARQVQLGLVLDDLIAMDAPLVQRGIGRFGLYGVRANLPDGTEAEPSIGYNNMFVGGALHALNWLEPTPDAEISAYSQQELLEDVIRRERWRLLALTYGRRQPLVLRQDGRQWPVERSNKVANDPLIARAMAAHAPESKETLTSVFFPWGGYNIIREDWTKDGQYGFMMSRPYLSPFGTRGVTDNLNLGIHAFGHDLLVDGVTSLYARSPSQVLVDGRNQFFMLDYQNPKEPFTATYLTDAWEKPSTARWLHGESFDFMEGTYSGRYGDERQEEQITDTTHERQVVFARNAGLWIVIDRLQAGGQPRSFSWRWMLPCSDKEETILTFKPGGRAWNPDGPAEERVAFEPVPARYVRLVALSAQGDTVLAQEIALETPRVENGVPSPGEDSTDLPGLLVKAEASSQHAPGNRSTQAANAIDGKPESAWESERGSLAKAPQFITLELDGLHTVSALRYLQPPGRGRIENYRIQTSIDGEEFQDVEQPSALIGEIDFDSSRKRIFTRKPDSPNLTLQTFTKVPLSFSSKTNLTAQAPSGKVCVITAAAENASELLAVTAILPRRSMAEDLTEVAPVSDDEHEGFSATTPNGAMVRSLAARDETAMLQSGSISAKANLLITVEKDGTIEGLVLGCEELTQDGEKISITQGDTTFLVDAQGRFLWSTPILPAIATVNIAPLQSVFIGEQVVTLSCPSPGVEIRYTIDGSEPSRASQLYTQPLTINETTRIRTRAFRIGLEEAPGTMDFTRDSAASSAVYELQQPLEALAEDASRQTGLHYRYFEGDWQKLYINQNLVEPTATGTVPALFDLAPKKTEGPFTFVYDGVIDVPETGVYTFHAPLELIDNRLIDAGYELFLEIGGRPWQPAMRKHAFGGWSIALQKGAHRFRLKYVDYRGDLLVGYNKKGERQELAIDHRTWSQPFDYLDMIKPLDTERRACAFVWVGPPRLEVSGPGLERQPLPAQWLHQ